MKIKKFLASILVFTIAISSLSLHVSANTVAQITGNNLVYSGKNVDVASWITSTIPSFNGVPNRVPGDVAFYSGKGEIKLNITDQNRSYFENGGSVKVYVNKACDAWNLNPLHWFSDFLAFGPKNGTNSFSFKIDRPNPSFFSLSKIISPALLDNPLSNLAFFGIDFFLFKYKSGKSGTLFALSYLLYPAIKRLWKCIFNPVYNLADNLNDNKVAFDYGIVLTDNADETVLNPNIPKVDDINEKLLSDKQKKEEKEKDILKKYNIKSNDTYYITYTGEYVSKKNPSNYRYTKEDVNKIKKDIEEHKPATYAKLANTRPINDDYVCTLDKNHPSQTFRFVINNQFPGNPNNADLFALALQNNSISLNQDDSKVSFIVAYNAISPNSYINTRLTNVPEEIQRKINLINNIGTPDTLSKIYNSIRNFFKNHLTLGDKIPVVPQGEQQRQQQQQQNQQQQNNNPGAAGANQADAGVNAGGEDDPFIAAATQAVRNRNAQLLKEATAVYKNDPSNANANNMKRASDAYKANEPLGQNVAQNIHNAYQQIPAAPQRHWYNPFSWRRR